MPTRIDQKIVAYSVASAIPASSSDATTIPSASPPPIPPAPDTHTRTPSALVAPAPTSIQSDTSLLPQPAQAPQIMGEHISRPQELSGTTYKIKPPVVDHALYVTINDMVLNPGTDHEVRRPFEIFVNSKNMEQFQWVVALTRIMSAVFRKGGDVTFMVEELKAVFDPKGGYFLPGGIYVPSMVADIGRVVERHLRTMGMLGGPVLTAAQLDLIAKKRAQAMATEGNEKNIVSNDSVLAKDGFPPSAVLCHKCSTRALVVLDGCETCLSCGYSKCG